LKRQGFSLPEPLVLLEGKRLVLSCGSRISEKEHPVFVGN
jgi:hypothetical protein